MTTPDLLRLLLLLTNVTESFYSNVFLRYSYRFIYGIPILV